MNIWVVISIESKVCPHAISSHGCEDQVEETVVG